MTDPLFDLCVVAYQAPGELGAMLESLHLLDPDVPFRLWVQDNSPDDDAWNVVLNVPDADGCVGSDRVHDRSNPGFARAVNRMVNAGSAPYVGVLNPDVQFLTGDTLAAIKTMFDEQPDVGIQGPRQHSSDGVLIHTGWCWSEDGQYQHQRGHGPHGHTSLWSDVVDVEMVTGSAMFLRRRMWNDLQDCPNWRRVRPDDGGPFLETQHFMEDSMVSAHAFEHRWRLVYRGDLRMIHECSRSASPDSEYVQEAWRTSRPLWESTMAEMGIPTTRTARSLS